MTKQHTRAVTLQFADLRSLFLFAQSISCAYLEINRLKNTLTSDCTEGEIQTAVLQYNAVLANSQVESN